MVLGPVSWAGQISPPAVCRNPTDDALGLKRDTALPFPFFRLGLVSFGRVGLPRRTQFLSVLLAPFRFPLLVLPVT